MNRDLKVNLIHSNFETFVLSGMVCVVFFFLLIVIHKSVHSRQLLPLPGLQQQEGNLVQDSFHS